MGKFERKASFTVEATMIMPMIFVLILFVIWYGFWLHDFIIVDSYVYLTAEEGRMARVYGKIPGEKNLLKDPLTDKKDIDKAQTMIVLKYRNVVKNTMAGSLASTEVAINKKSVNSEAFYAPGVFKYYKKANFLKARTMAANKDITNPAFVTRVTTVVYRLIRTLVKL